VHWARQVPGLIYWNCDEICEQIKDTPMRRERSAHLPRIRCNREEFFFHRPTGAERWSTIPRYQKYSYGDKQA